MALELRRHRFTVDEYYRMAEAGILNEDSRVELIDGEIVDMPPIGSHHGGSVDRSNEVFFRRFVDVAQVRVRNPVRLDMYNEPEPDLALLRRRDDFYRTAHPTPADVLLFVEVADSLLAEDRRTKLPLYARYAIREVWLVDLPNRVVHVYRDPAPDGYRLVQTARSGDRIAPLAFPDRDLDVAELLG
ncbi:MAG: Uma2 family endonuclease [Chloroflexi bacterium]|nr:Uma2 family endonuclease [Chloroflexota bacterium]